MRSLLRCFDIAAGTVEKPVPGPGDRHCREVAIAVAGHLAVPGEQPQEDRAAGTREPRDIEGPLDRDLLDLLPQEIAFPLPEAQPETRVLLNPAAQLVLPSGNPHGRSASGRSGSTVSADLAHSMRRRCFRRKAAIISAAKKVASHPRNQEGPKERISIRGRPSWTRSTGASSGR